MSHFLLAIDQGTSSTKALIIHEGGRIVSEASVAIRSHYPSPGFVEQDPEQIYQSAIKAVRLCLDRFYSAYPSGNLDLAACGISNQRETFLLWDKRGKPLSNAIGWQCKRSVSICEELLPTQVSDLVQQKTGLKVDPCFSATKLTWLIRKHQDIELAIKGGKAFFGTIDTWLLYRLTKGEVFATDHTNASRTLLFNIYDLTWDEQLLSAFGAEHLNLPEVHPSAYRYGATDLEGVLENEILITGLIGDSHAAAFGEGCYAPGQAKATMGTGCSILWNTGQQPVSSKRGMVTTICWSTEQELHYALEGVIVSCGSTLEWLRNQLGLFDNYEELMLMATDLADNEGVYLIPAFSGLGAPHWQMSKRASIHGLTFQSGKEHLVRAGLESVLYQIKDVIAVMEQESGHPLKLLMVDGGLTNNGFAMQNLADLLSRQVVNMGTPHVSGLGAGLIAGIGINLYGSLSDLPGRGTEFMQFDPTGHEAKILHSYSEWCDLIKG